MKLKHLEENPIFHKNSCERGREDPWNEIETRRTS